MRIVLTLPEVQEIVADLLEAKGLNIDRKSGSFKTYVEGQYDEAIERVEGISFEVKI